MVESKKMKWGDVFMVITAVFGSVGGAAVLLLGCASWLGKIWASRILEKDRAKYSREMEKLRSDYGKELEFYKSQLEVSEKALSRYSESQFYLYNKVWSSLANLKILCDRLLQTETVGKADILNLWKQITEVKKEVFRSSLLIEEEHIVKLNALLRSFSKLGIGQYELLDVEKERNKPVFNDALYEALKKRMIQQEIESIKKEYDSLILLIEGSFRRQLKLDKA